MRFLALLLVLVSVSCKTANPKSALEELQEAVEAYNHAYRWKNYERAALFLPPDLRAAFMTAYEEDASSLQVENYQITRVDFHNDTHATISVRVQYMLLPAIVVQNTTLVQEWHKIQDQWILESEKNSIRSLLPESEPAPDWE